MTELTPVERTAILTVYKRKKLYPDVYNRLWKLYPRVVAEFNGLIEHDDVYSLELVIRQALLKEAVLETNSNLVIELGCGLSSLGRDVGKVLRAKVVEVDLPGIIEIRKAIYTKDEADNIETIAGDVTSDALWNELRKYVQKNARICVICEGLLRYIPMAQKHYVGTKIIDIISPNGIWISCDLTLTEMLSRERARADIKEDVLAETVVTKTFANAFSSKVQCMDFFSNIGFEVEIISAAESDHNISNKYQGYTDLDVIEASRYINILKMRVHINR